MRAGGAGGGTESENGGGASSFFSGRLQASATQRLLGLGYRVYLMGHHMGTDGRAVPVLSPVDGRAFAQVCCSPWSRTPFIRGNALAVLGTPKIISRDRTLESGSRDRALQKYIYQDRANFRSNAAATMPRCEYNMERYTGITRNAIPV